MPRGSSGRGREGGGGGGDRRAVTHQAAAGRASATTWAHDQAVELLNNAKLTTEASGKASCLKQLQELVLHKEPSLLEVFLTPILELQVDPAASVRRWVAGVCEQVGARHPEHIAPCLAAIRQLLNDGTPIVIKAAVKSGAAVFREALIEAATKGEGPIVPGAVREMWSTALGIKDDVRRLVLGERVNDGVRLQAVKFLELVILLFHGREWGSGIVSHDHATISLDELATEADVLLGVLLECLKPEVCASQAGTVTLVMIGVASNVSQKLPVYLDFVLPSLLELAAWSVEKAAGGEGGAAVDSISKELRGALLLVLKSGLPEVEPFKDDLVAHLKNLGADEQVESVLRQADRAASKRKERDARQAPAADPSDDDPSLGHKRQRTTPFVDDGRWEGGDRPTGGDNVVPLGARERAFAATDPGLLAQVLQTVAALASNHDRAMLNAFITQLAPEVLADVVIANVSHLGGVGGRVMIDVRAGAGAGAEGCIDAALAAHERSVLDGASNLDGVGAGSAAVAARAVGPPDVMTAGRVSSDGDLTDLAASRRRPPGVVTEGAGETKAPPPPPLEPTVVAPFEPTVRAMTGADRRGQSAAALSRIVRAADPGGAVASMGGAALQAALFTRLAASSVAAAAAREGEGGGGGPVGRVRSGAGGGEKGAFWATSDARAASDAEAGAGLAAAGLKEGGAEGGAGRLMEYLVSALPDPVAHAAAVRLLGAVFVNETLGGAESTDDAEAPSTSSSSSGGVYARTLMTLAMGLAESDAAPRSKHLTRLLLDAPSVPPPALRLLRAMCRLPLDAPTTGGKTDADGFSTDASGSRQSVGGGVGGIIKAVRWGGRPVPSSEESVTLALTALQGLIVERPKTRGACLEIVLEAATHSDDAVRSRAIRLVAAKLHASPRLAGAIEAFATHHLGEAAGAGARELEAAKALAAKAAAAMKREAAAKAAATKARAEKAAALKAEAEGRKVDVAGVTPEGEAVEASSEAAAAAAAAPEEDAAAAEAAARVEAAAAATAVASTERHLLLYCALCTRKHALVPALFATYAALPEALRPAVLSGASFDALVRAVGPTSAPLVEVIAAPPAGAEALARRAIEVLAEATASMSAAAAGSTDGEAPRPPPPRTAPAKLVAAAESLAAAEGDDVTVLLPLLGSLSPERVRALVPALVAQPLDAFRRALDVLTASTPPAPLSASEILVALHDVDPAKHGVPLKKIIAACGECFERPATFTAEALAAALQKMVECTPLPLLFMRSVIQAETSAPTLKEFVLGLLRTLVRRQVWKMDPKIWEGFMRCAKRATPRSFPVLCELPPAALGETLAKFPALREPLRAYSAAPSVAQGIPRAIHALLAQKSDAS